MASAEVETDDAITRTFDVHEAADLQSSAATGIYSPDSPCPATVFNVTVGVTDVVYYQDDRETTNAKEGQVDVFPGTSVPLTGLSCPLPGSGPSDLLLAIGPNDIHFAYEGVRIDQMICVQGNLDTGGAVDCFPDPNFSLAIVAHCNKDDAIFMPSPDDGKSALLNLAGSRSIKCGVILNELKNKIHYYNNGPQSYCKSWFFEPNAWGTDHCIIQVEDTTPQGNGVDDTGYLVTCMFTRAFVVDPLKEPMIYKRDFATHDWKLVIDLDGSPHNAIAAKVKHWGGDPPLQGWHDLGGKNGFPCLGSAANPPDKKVNDFPRMPTPLSEKK